MPLFRALALAAAAPLLAWSFAQVEHAATALGAEEHAHGEAGCAACATSANAAADAVAAVPSFESVDADGTAAPYAAPFAVRAERHADSRGPPAGGA